MRKMSLAAKPFQFKSADVSSKPPLKYDLIFGVETSEKRDEPINGVLSGAPPLG